MFKLDMELSLLVEPHVLVFSWSWTHPALLVPDDVDDDNSNNKVMSVMYMIWFFG